MRLTRDTTKIERHINLRYYRKFTKLLKKVDLSNSKMLIHHYKELTTHKNKYYTDNDFAPHTRDTFIENTLETINKKIWSDGIPTKSFGSVELINKKYSSFEMQDPDFELDFCSFAALMELSKTIAITNDPVGYFLENAGWTMTWKSKDLKIYEYNKLHFSDDILHRNIGYLQELCQEYSVNFSIGCLLACWITNYEWYEAYISVFAKCLTKYQGDVDG